MKQAKSGTPSPPVGFPAPVDAWLLPNGQSLAEYAFHSGFPVWLTKLEVAAVKEEEADIEALAAPALR